MAKIKLCQEPKISKTQQSWIFPVFGYVLEHVSDVTLSEKQLDYLCINSKSEITNVFNDVEGHCLQAMKIVHHHANGNFDWLISEHQTVNPSREAISVLSEKYKRFTFVHPVETGKISKGALQSFSSTLYFCERSSEVSVS